MADSPEASTLPEIGRVTVAELIASLKAGSHDFRRAPLYGLAFSSFYVAVGFLLVSLGAGTFLWTLALSLGFPLIAPFAAVGLYETSRRLEAGEPLEAREIFGVVLGERRRQIPWIGLVLLLIFLFWSFFAHMLFAMFMGLSPLTEFSTSRAALVTPNGLAMIALQVAVGAGVAFLAFAVSVVSLPLLLEREVDFVTAMILSVRTVRANLAVMLLWAAIIAGLLIIGMAPWFLGLCVVLPVLGHATWHLYRRALYDPL